MSDLKEKLQQTLGGNYTLERELGGGGMSRVFVAEETALGRKVVVKVLPSELAAAVNLERFHREIQVAARLSHPHIVPVLAAGSSNGLPYYTMPFIEGESLRGRIARHGELPTHDAARILRDILSALAYAHEHGVIHRDIKPDNILLSGGHALVADFGVAKALSASTDSGSSLTSMGVALGTPAYMAPEQAAGDPTTDHRADLYAVGAVAYEMLTGYQLFSARSPQAMLAAHATETPEPILKKRGSIPPLLAALVMRALEKRPADRPQTAGEMLALLAAATTPSGATTPFAGGMEPHKPAGNSKRNLVIGISAVSALLAVGAVTMFRPRASGGAGAAETPIVTTPSLAVLPFENLGSAADKYFADGMAEEISSRLGKLSGLRVVGRQSVRGYANSDKSIQQIGKELGVSYVLTGSIRWDKSGGKERVRVSPALLKVSDASQLWSEAYEDVVNGVFQIQSSVGEKVAQALQVQLTSGEVKSLTRRPTDNLEAYDFYLRGQATGQSWVLADILKSIALFEKAVALDPAFVDAYAALGDANVNAFWFGDYRTERLRNSRAAIDRALALDPNSARARSAAANYYYYGSRDYARALDELTIAERLAPNEAYTKLVKARVLRRKGQFAEAIDTQRDILRLDPGNLSALSDLAETQNFAGRYDDALSTVQRLLQIDPSMFQAYLSLSKAWIAGKGDVAKGVDAFHQAAEHIAPKVLGPNLVSLNASVWPGMLDPQILELMHLQKAPEAPGAQIDFYSARGLLAAYEKQPDQMRAAGLAIRKVAEKQWPGLWSKGSSSPGTIDLTPMVALGHAFLGESAEAMRLALKAVDDMPSSRDAVNAPFNLEMLANVAVLGGNRVAAVSALEKLVALGGRNTVASIKVDPKWESLRNDPGFIRLTSAK